MYKKSVYTLVNGDTQCLTLRKQQKSLKDNIILFNSTLTVRRCDGEWYHLLWFLLFSKCQTLHLSPLKSV